MKKSIFIALLATAIGCGGSAVAQVSFSGNSLPVFTETPAASTGLNHIYVLNRCDGVTMSYTAASAGASVVWLKYGAQGGGYAEEITTVRRNGAVTTIDVIPNCGYIIEEGTKRTYVWVVNYLDYYLSLDAISLSAEQDCGTVMLDVAGSGPDINYYTITGVPKKLDREMKLSYSTLEWNADELRWEQKLVEESFDVLKPTISVAAPYCDTQFTLSGDKLLRYWGEEDVVESDSYNTKAVAVEATAVQEERDNANEKKVESESLGGSAPVTVTFAAYPTDAVVHKEWQMARDAEFADIVMRKNEEEMTSTFTEAGTFYLRFIGNNANGDCEAESATYTVAIGTSALECPNVFSPTSTEGVNDEWRVSYKSIVEFQCHIFNKWGVKMCELSDPSQGWDGKYKGKFVKSGTYYYVIQARGADGRKYNLKGDINIINYSNRGVTGGSTDAGE